MSEDRSVGEQVIYNQYIIFLLQHKFYSLLHLFYLLITLCLLSKKEWWGQYKPKGQELSNKGGKMKVMILAEDLI